MPLEGHDKAAASAIAALLMHRGCFYVDDIPPDKLKDVRAALRGAARSYGARFTSHTTGTSSIFVALGGSLPRGGTRVVPVLDRTTARAEDERDRNVSAALRGIAATGAEPDGLDLRRLWGVRWPEVTASVVSRGAR
ncbi:MAG TPA: hypothetical protein VHD87_15460 [Acidimicrobiales bacterium]|nr:hypothetical protein [Acidimicrobiales bacterium]